MKTTIHTIAFALTLTAAVLSGPAANAQAVSTTTTSTTTSAGMVSELSPDALVIRTESSTTPIRYGFSSSTVYVDEAGTPVSRELIRSGVPVTVSYTRVGDKMIADRVVVRRQTTTTTETSPTMIEKNTQTTITKPPVVVEKPVIVEKIVEKPVVVEKIVDRPVIVEKKVPVIVKSTPEVIEEKTTKTTTTTEGR